MRQAFLVPHYVPYLYLCPSSALGLHVRLRSSNLLVVVVAVVVWMVVVLVLVVDVMEEEVLAKVSPVPHQGPG
jgi:hypothetical protein